MRARSSVLTNTDGAAAVEAALVLPLFLIMMIGFIKLCMLLWTIGSLHYAVESAARCAAVDKTTCSSAAAIESYAFSRYFGEHLTSTPSTLFHSVMKPCGNTAGHTVTAAYTYSFVIPFIPPYSVELAAEACFP